MERHLSLPVNYTTCQQDTKNFDTLFRQSLPIGYVCLSLPSSTSHQNKYGGYPVTCTIKTTFHDFTSAVQNNGNRACFPNEEEPLLGNEYEAGVAFLQNVLTPLKTYFKSYQTRGQESQPSNLSTPDFQLYHLEEKGYFLCVEMKSCNAFCHDTTGFDTMSEKQRADALARSTPLPDGIVPKEFLNDIKRQKDQTGNDESIGRLNFRRALRQLKYYLFNMGTTEAYGILSSYCHTYFAVLKCAQKGKSDELIVSPVVSYRDNDALKKIAEFIQKAYTAVREPRPKEKHTISLTKETAGSRGEEGVITKLERGGKRSKDEEKLAVKKQRKQTIGRNRTKYTVGNVIGRGRNGCVLEMFDEKDQLFAAKCVGDKCSENVNRELKNEEHVYEILKPLQGIVVPEIHLCGYLDGWRHIILMELLNAQSMQNLDHLSDEQKRAVVAALDKVHQMGILHGDIKEENILLHRYNHRQAYLIDFGFATECDSTESFDKEQQELRSLLDMK